MSDKKPNNDPPDERFEFGDANEPPQFGPDGLGDAHARKPTQPTTTTEQK